MSLRTRVVLPDISIGPPYEVTQLPINGEVLLRRRPRTITLRLVDWKRDGLRIEYEIDYFGSGRYNRDRPYQDPDTARKAYHHLVKQIEKRRYVIEIHGDGNVILRLENPSDAK